VKEPHSSALSQGCCSAILPAQALSPLPSRFHAKHNICVLQLLWELPKHPNLTFSSQQVSLESSFLAAFSTCTLSCSTSSTPRLRLCLCLRQRSLVISLELFQGLSQVPSASPNFPTHRPFPSLQCPKTYCCLTAGSIPNSSHLEYF